MTGVAEFNCSFAVWGVASRAICGGEPQATAFAQACHSRRSPCGDWGSDRQVCGFLGHSAVWLHLHCSYLCQLQKPHLWLTVLSSMNLSIILIDCRCLDLDPLQRPTARELVAVLSCLPATPPFAPGLQKAGSGDLGFVRVQPSKD